ncbi:MAG: extracellular solute-binding protein, partial [Clostridiales bacterium]|nr:extracellular solute-binding protein [Clostridiales bacterium]
MKKVLALILTLAMALSLASLTACGSSSSSSTGTTDSSAAGDTTDAEASGLPTIDSITLGEDYQDITATVTILTNRTDIADTTYAAYAEEFHELYPNITVEYEAITDYEETLQLRLTTGDWGDICFIPTSVSMAQLSDYFIPLGDYDTLDEIYNFVSEATYDGTVYGIANGCTDDGLLYQTRRREEAFINQ